MSNILKRIEKANRGKAAKAPESTEKAIVDQYLADIKEKAKDEARLEIENQLIEAANEAELEGARLKIESVQSEANTLRDLLANEKSQVAQLNDLVKSLKAELKNKSIALEEEENEYELTIKEMSDQIKALEMALIEEKNKPAPAPQIIKPEPQITPTGFKAIPNRGPDGRTIDVTLEPIYERPN